jgi:hypothetical protein
MTIMSGTEFWANIVGLVGSLIAACCWLWASLTKIPPFPDVGFDSGSWVFEPVRAALGRANKRNAIAAFFAALAAASYVVIFACHLFQS